MQFPLGLVDIPEEQSQEEYIIDIEKEGNLGYFSASGYGKSTVLTTCILSLARQNTVSNLNFYIFDFGNSALIPLKELHHTADYITYDDEEKRNKFFKLIQMEMKQRKQLLAQKSAQNFTVYNQIAEEPLKAIVIIVDNMDILKEIGMDEEEEFTKIARDGAGLGIYLIFSAQSESGIRYGTLNNIKQKVAGYMYDASDISSLVGRGEYTLPDKKGRAMVNLLQLEQDEKYDAAYAEYRKELSHKQCDVELLSKLAHLALILEKKEEAKTYYAKIEGKVTEEDIIGLIKEELPLNSVEIKKRGSKGLKW